MGNSFINNFGSAIHIASGGFEEEQGAAGEALNLININRIVGNTAYGVYLEPMQTLKAPAAGDLMFMVNATNNWWGSKSNPKTFGSTAHVIADVTHNNLGQDTSILGHIPDGTPITITTDIGNVGSKSIVKYTLSGIATAILRADDGFGTANLFAILDNFRTPVPANVVIVQAATVQAGTIGMQNTGVPLAGLLLALIMVLSGFVTGKKQ